MIIKYFSPKKVVLISNDNRKIVLYAPPGGEFDYDTIKKIWE